MVEPGPEIGVEDALGWVGFKLDDMSGASAGRVDALLVDAHDGYPTWVVVRLGRFGRRIAVPVEFVVAGVGHVWVPFERDALRSASDIDPARGLSCGEERALAERFGIPAEGGRFAAISDRDDEPGSVPAGS